MKIPFLNYELAPLKDVENVDKAQPKSSRITTRIVNRQLQRQKQDIQKFLNAVQSAENVLNPDRTELIRSYKDVVLDSHLAAALSTVRLKVQGAKYILVDSEGQKDEDETKKIQTRWFREFAGYAIDAEFWGHSLIQLGAIKNDAFTSVQLVPREYVIPEKQLVKTNLFVRNSGQNYTVAPYKNWLVEVNGCDLGLLHKAAFWALWKKNIVASWSEFSEIFGAPVRIGRTDINNPDNLKNIDRYLKEMGSAAYAVLDREDEIEFLETTRGDAYNVYNEFIERANSEMSKLILGQTGTTDEKSFTGAANVHAGIFDMRSMFFIQFVADIFNEKLYSLMQLHGMIKPGLKMTIEQGEKTTETEKQNFVIQLLNSYDIAPEWINQEFNIPVEEMASAPQTGGDMSGVENKITTVMHDVDKLYNEVLLKHKH